MDEDVLQKVTEAYGESVDWLKEVAKNPETPFKERLDAIRGIHSMYDNHFLLEKISDLVEDHGNAANKVVEQVKRLKPKRPDWMGDDEGEE